MLDTTYNKFTKHVLRISPYILQDYIGTPNNYRTRHAMIEGLHSVFKDEYPTLYKLISVEFNEFNPSEIDVVIRKKPQSNGVKVIKYPSLPVKARPSLGADIIDIVNGVDIG